MADIANDWVNVPPAPASPANDNGGWVDVPPAGHAGQTEPTPAGPMSALNESAAAFNQGLPSPYITGIMEAFGRGAKEGFGDEKIGLSDESVKALSKAGIFERAGATKYESPAKAFNEAIMVPAVAALDLTARGMNAAFRGGQAAVKEALGGGTFGRDIAALPEAFFGSPHPTGMFKAPAIERPRITGGTADTPNVPVARDLGVIGPERPPITAGTPAEAAKAAVQPITAYHGSPYSFDVFTSDKIGTGEGAQSYGHGLYFAENEAVAADYRSQLAATDDAALHFLTMAGNNAKRAEALYRSSLDAGERPDPATLRAIAAGPQGTGVVYQVRIHADIDRFLDWDKPLSEQPKSVQDAAAAAWKEAGMDGRPPDTHTGADLVHDLERVGKDEASRILHEAGIPGTKFLDQGSRKPATAAEIAAQEEHVRGLEASGNPNLADAAAKAREILADMKRPQTRNFVVFDDAAIEITHKNGESVTPPGPPPGPPEPPQSPPGTGPEKAAIDKAGNIRLDLIAKPDDVLDVIRKAAEDQGGPDAFMAARRGEIPLAQVDALSQATGIAPDELNLRGMGRLMRNDQEVRAAIQAMIQSAEETAAAMKKAALTGSDADLIEFQRLRMRHSVLQEQVAGLTAEWGRTGNVFQEFGEGVKDAKSLGAFLKEKKGETLDDLRAMAKAGAELDPRTQLPKFMQDSRKPGFFDKMMWYWVNALISGPFTHAKYIIANSAFAGYEAAVATPIAAALGLGRRIVAGEATDRVYFGEVAMRSWGMIAGTPDALVAAWKAARTGLQTPLPGELAQGIIPKNNKNIAFQQRPIEGAVGTVVGLPSRGASFIHSFFNFLGYRSSIEAQAYRAAAREGLSPMNDAFWQRRADLAAKPDKAMMDKAIEEGYKLTFITELGPGGKKISSAINSFPPARLIMPFTHIPMNILKGALENTPAAALDAGTRANLLGKNGAVAQDTAIARIVGGAAIGAWAVNLVANDRMTGAGPTDPKERAQWVATGHQPYSIRIGDYWVSYNRFGPLGTLLGLHANLADVMPHMQWDGEELTKAVAMTVHSTGRLMMDEVGMQGLAGLIEAINEPERKGTRFVSSFAGSWLPYSSLLRQTASFMDPQMREAKTVIDGLRYQIPAVREGLYPKRDWTGSPIENPGYHSIMRTGTVRDDPVAIEMKTLNLHPAPPEDRIAGVKLPQALYDRYQSTAGPFTRMSLENLVQQPNWYSLPLYVREEMFRNTIKSTRQSAAAAMQAAYPQLIQQAVEDKVNHLTGRPKTKLQE